MRDPMGALIAGLRRPMWFALTLVVLTAGGLAAQQVPDLGQDEAWSSYQAKLDGVGLTYKLRNLDLQATTPASDDNVAFTWPEAGAECPAGSDVLVVVKRVPVPDFDASATMLAIYDGQLAELGLPLADVTNLDDGSSLSAGASGRSDPAWGWWRYFIKKVFVDASGPTVPLPNDVMWASRSLSTSRRIQSKEKTTVRNRTPRRKEW